MWAKASISPLVVMVKSLNLVPMNPIILGAKQ
jgi:hypothetical protein